jgi:hypothetical protein
MPRGKRFTVQASGLESLKKQLEQYPAAALKVAKGGFFVHLRPYLETMQQRSSTGPLYRASGRLQSSWIYEVARIYSHRAYYAYTHEFGESRTAKAGSWIFIPTVFNTLGRVKTQSRKTIASPSKVLASGGSYKRLREIDQQYKDLLGQRLTRTMLCDAEGKPMFALVKSAKYHPVLGFFAEGEKYTDLIPRAIGDRLIAYWQAPSPGGVG